MVESELFILPDDQVNIVIRTKGEGGTADPISSWISDLLFVSLCVSRWDIKNNDGEMFSFLSRWRYEGREDMHVATERTKVSDKLESWERILDH
ncbi:hypothetical protein CTI12_AA468680 [Artemisia annua]|uniref:Uncharacterized protein n=1 Tax=Artemisia annua TaxID=35608 RepID=A0A2U1LNB6_ARTAN|nr:hypothetical protein CTI12_AA468680 [Artemisia annua]